VNVSRGKRGWEGRKFRLQESGETILLLFTGSGCPVAYRFFREGLLGAFRHQKPTNLTPEINIPGVSGRKWVEQDVRRG